MLLGCSVYMTGGAAERVRLAQLDRAFGYGPKGRGFESSNARYFLRGGNADKWAFPFFLKVFVARCLIELPFSA